MNRTESAASFAYTYEEMLFFIESELTPGTEQLTLEYPGDSEFPDHAVVKDSAQTESIAFGGTDVIGATAPGRHYWEGLDHYINSHASEDSRLRSTLPAAVNILGSEVVPIARHVAERARQGLTLEAMHGGADIIVGGQLVTGQFAGLVDIMVRQQGSSEFGDYFYMPCGIRNGDELYAALRLCFIADLLQNMQGVLPPELLLFHDLKAPESLNTELYIQYFRALKYRFIASRYEFPDETISASHEPAAPVATGLQLPGGSAVSGIGAVAAGEGRRHNWSLATALDVLLNMRKADIAAADTASTFKLVGREENTAACQLPRYGRGPTFSAAQEPDQSDKQAEAPASDRDWDWGAAEASSQ